MILCDEITVEEWSPDFASSGQANPLWQRLRCGPITLCNSLEGIDWLTNPVQVELCEACGVQACSPDGYVHYSEFDGYVFWTRPQATGGGPSKAVAQHGAVAFPAPCWEQIRGAVAGIPPAASLTRANGSALAGAWANGPGRPTDLSRLLPMLQSQLLAADTLSRAEVLRWMTHWADWFSGPDEVPQVARLAPLAGTAFEVETLHLDGHPEGGWAALARRGNEVVPLFATGQVLLLKH
ncbi:hypothetical protein [Paludibaculum fermentans]|uniref:hypothetical protein n=1 Tax=Paludibaculum fermentans TaxID=1473598 RepID=UPI003EC155EB